MARFTGTVSRGLRAPIISEGDDLREIVVNTVLGAASAGEFEIRDKDIVAVTEAVLARAQGNYATIEQIGEDVREKTGGQVLGVVFPILSRNRFSICLKGIAKGTRKIVLMLSFPSDEVGNHLVPMDALDEKNINPYVDVLSENDFKEAFGETKHTFTGMNYVDYYKELIKAEGTDVEVVFANDPRRILEYTDVALACDIHTRARTKRLLKAAGAKTVIGLDDILTESVSGSGCNRKYGILGSNKATEDKIKLFPEGCDSFVREIQAEIREKTGRTVEVMVYGDGAFKDPVGRIWELADPVVSPGYTKGLEGTPNEVKLKYIADNEFPHLKGDELKAAISEYIRHKGSNLGEDMAAQGTTPRKLADLVGSLCDLTSGSGDKGTPIVYVQGYFDNYTD
ncbi:MAG: coenzyme F420-0:L-glutamate ligase [Clostridiales bacterium]|nr:coenzyme F420-0:L-glutamate ligase [Clostridiales bacterium]